MAFDGITIAAIRKELADTLINGRISKIAQPEPDELLLTIKTPKGQFKLVLSANPSLPLAYLTEENKVSPMTAPPFCMLLRKHIQNGRILSITQPDFERILVFKIEHLNELGDICRKFLIVELMGKYSNIIFVAPEEKENSAIASSEIGNGLKIIDSIKRISAAISSVREVLPGKDYFIPSAEGKSSPIAATREDFYERVLSKHEACHKALLSSYNGISPMIAHEVCEIAEHIYAASCNATSNYTDGMTNLSEKMASDLTASEKEHFYQAFCLIFDKVKSQSFTPAIYYENNVPKEYSCVPISSYENAIVTTSESNQATGSHKISYDSASALIRDYYSQKEKHSRSRQKSADLRKILSTILERDVKKYDLQCRQIKDTEKMDTYRIYGELLQTYGYSIEPGAKSATVDNYYTNEPITIPLDETKTPLENARRYFDKYGKCKRTKEALTELIVQVKEEITHLESILTALDIAEKEEDLNQIREEMMEYGYIRRKGSKQKQRFVSKPFHYVSSDGFDIYVGKNNYQNDELTFKFATGNDWWFHAKGMPGSHVILKNDGREIPDSTFEEAGRLAAYYSKGRGQEKVEIDYTPKKNIKKTPGGKPGFVIYHTNYSLNIDSNIEGIQQM